MIELRNINKKYDEKIVLEDINLSFQKGKITSLIGSNGAGKSTLLGVASRLLSPDSGEVLFDGKNLKTYKNSELAKKISILKQQNHLNIRLRVKELVSFGRFPHSAGKLGEKDKQKIAQAIEFMGLKDLEDRFLDSLSGGQKQRAFIAMIIAQDTDYIMLDEPLNNLDMKNCVHIMKMLQRLVLEFDKSIILVLHDINFASVYSDTIIAMKNARVLFHGDTKDIIQSEILREIYDFDIKIQEINSKKICVYYE
ncbi:iron ABC transporter ATP-binding protein [Campylobacter sp. MIT 12-8780]|uniref:iron ABC transporter ATP-binding protein n=1 Tax=unclassified Campylobacter TaxID=2593542 RepID=UPI0010FA28CA|nr:MULTISPECIES: ATP-binding cassette domain-containing protein [unclassified Campylobacter]NDJ27517.1 ATP-binding cassette domain-containing protein [Campylobacter sp. MIT 19-121]TKX28791.1 iron ABC transporter ATP-binding protein [Campylobacter sp. MIT 12-5580]TQR41273.1 iron ABC transporter ATP-binding protein [Campylobacter sp. MIT 12-8780]